MLLGFAITVDYHLNQRPGNGILGVERPFRNGRLAVVIRQQNANVIEFKELRENSKENRVCLKEAERKERRISGVEN